MPLLSGAWLRAAPRPMISEDRELTDIDVSAWDCLHRPEGTAKTPDGVERNRSKSREAVELKAAHVVAMDTGAFLKHVAEFDRDTKGKHRTDLNPAQRQQLEALEKQAVSLTGWLVLTYVGPPETTNCASSDFHDWHMELFEKPADHPPQVGDPTPIICEITPRTQRAIFRDGIRMQALAGFFRHPDMSYEKTGHPARQIRVTGLLAWDDDHNGAADLGPTIKSFSANKYHHPWRSTPWEIHPAMKIEILDATGAPNPPSAAPMTPSGVQPMTAPSPAITPSPAQHATLLQPVTIKIPYGQTTIARGTRLEVVTRDAKTVTVRFDGTAYAIPISSTDLQ